ncbi:MAG: DUF4276 family protein [bacterium]
MHFEVLVEEPSAKTVINALLPPVMGAAHTYEVRVFQGKQDLLKKLPERLKGYKKWVPPDWKIIVLVDLDRHECHELKNKLEKIAAASTMTTKSVNEHRFQVVNRVVIEELEAWFFGDIKAMRAAYPRLPYNLESKKAYRNPDMITKPSEALWRLLQRSGYYKNVSRMPKNKVARDISLYMDPSLNTSQSFRVFRDFFTSYDQTVA